MSSPPPLAPAPRRWRPPDDKLVDRLNKLAEDGGEDEDIEKVDALLSPARQNSTSSTRSAASAASNLSKTSTASSTRSGRTLKVQVTGESLARQYDDLYASLDALANPFEETKLDTPKGVQKPMMPPTPQAGTPTPKADTLKPGTPQPKLDSESKAASLTASSTAYPSTPAGLSGHGLGINLSGLAGSGASKVTAELATPVEVSSSDLVRAAPSDANVVSRSSRPPSPSKSVNPSVASPPPQSASRAETLGVRSPPFSPNLSTVSSFRTALSSTSPAPPLQATSPTTPTQTSFALPSNSSDAPPPVPSKSPYQQRRVTPTKRSGSALETPASKRSVASPSGTPGKARVSNLMKMFEAAPATVSPAKASSVSTAGRTFKTAPVGTPTPTRIPSATPSGPLRSVAPVESPSTILDAPRGSWQVRSNLPPPVPLDLGPLKYVPPPTPARKLSKSPPSRRTGSFSRSSRARSPPALRSPTTARASPPPRAALGASPGASSVKNMIAAWRARSASSGPPQPSFGTVAESMALDPQATGNSAGGQSSSSVLTGVTGGLANWNMSIRRRRMEESSRAVVEEEPEPPRTPSPPTPNVSSGASRHSAGRPSNPASISSRVSHVPSTSSSIDRQFTGEPLRTGVLYYFQVHVGDHYEWIWTDARLYPSALVLTHRTTDGREVRIVLDLINCDEVQSTQSPINSRSDDIGAIVAMRDRDFANSLYPFRLQYDDGQERLGCDTPMERAYWVRALWGALDQLSATAPRPAGSVISGGSGMTNASGSSSTRMIMTEAVPTGVMDDAVVATAGGMSAPLVHRDSKRLAPKKSLRRAASDVDLRAADPDLERLTATRSEGPSSYMTPRSGQNAPTLATYPASTVFGAPASTAGAPTDIESSTAGPRSVATLPTFAPSTVAGPAPTFLSAGITARPGSTQSTDVLRSQSAIDAASDIGPSVSEYASGRSGSQSGYAGSESTNSSSLSAASHTLSAEIETIDVNVPRPMSYPMSAPSEIVIPGATWPPQSGSSDSLPGYTTDPESIIYSSHPEHTSGYEASGASVAARTGDFASPATGFATPAFDAESSTGLPSLSVASDARQTPFTPTSEYSAWPSGESSDQLSLTSAEFLDTLEEPAPPFRGSEAPSSARSGSATVRGGYSTATPGRRSQQTSAATTPKWSLRDPGPVPPSEGSAYMTPGGPRSRPRSLPPPSDAGASDYETSLSQKGLEGKVPGGYESERSGHVADHSTAGRSTPTARSQQTASHPTSSHRSTPSRHSRHPSEPSFDSNSSSHQSSARTRHSQPASHRSSESSHSSSSGSYQVPSSHSSSHHTHSTYDSTRSHRSSPVRPRSNLSAPPSEAPRAEAEPPSVPYNIHVDVPIHLPGGPPSDPSSSAPSSSSSGHHTDSATRASSSSRQPEWSSSSTGSYETARQPSPMKSPLMERLMDDAAPLSPSSTTGPQPIKSWAAAIRAPPSEVGNQSYYTPTSASAYGTGVAPPTQATSTAFIAPTHEGFVTARASVVTGLSSQYATAGSFPSSGSSSAHPPPPAFSRTLSLANTHDPNSPFGTPPFESAVPVSPGWSTHRGLPSYAPTEAGTILPSRPWSIRGTTPTPRERERSVTPQSIADVNVADLERMSSMGSNVSRLTEQPSSSSDNHLSTPSDSRGYQTASTHETFATGTVAYATGRGTHYHSAESLQSPRTATSTSVTASSFTVMPPSSTTTSTSRVPTTSSEAASSVPSWARRRPDYADVEQMSTISGPSTVRRPTTVPTASTTSPSTFRNVIPSEVTTQPGSIQPVSTSVKSRTVSGSTTTTQGTTSVASNSSGGSSSILRPFMNNGRGDVAISRLINRILAYEDVRDTQTVSLRTQLDRMEKALHRVETREPIIVREVEKPPPVPAKDEPSDPSSSSSSSTVKPTPKKIPRKPPPSFTLSALADAEEETVETDMADAEVSSVSSESSDETAMPVTPKLTATDINARFDEMSTLFGKMLGQQQNIMDELDRRDPSRIEQLLDRILAATAGGANSPTLTAQSEWREGGMYPGSGSVYTDSLGQQWHTPQNSEIHALETRTATTAPTHLSSVASPMPQSYHPSQDSEIKGPSGPHSELPTPWMAPPMHLPKSIVDRFADQEPQIHTPAYQPQATYRALPGDYPAEAAPTTAETVPEPFQDAESTDGHGEGRPIRVRAEQDAQIGPEGSSEVSANLNDAQFSRKLDLGAANRGPTPQQINLPTPLNDRRELPRQGPAPSATAPHPTFLPSQMPGPVPVGQVPLASPFVHVPPATGGVPPSGGVPRAATGYMPHMTSTPGFVPPYPSAPIRTPARTPMSTIWRSRDMGPRWRHPMMGPGAMMNPGLRPMPPWMGRPYPYGAGGRRPSTVAESFSSISSTSRSSSSSKTSSSSSSSSTVTDPEDQKRAEELDEEQKKLNQERAEFEEQKRKEDEAHEKEVAARKADDAEKQHEEEMAEMARLAEDLEKNRQADEEFRDDIREELKEEIEKVKASHLASHHSSHQGSRAPSVVHDAPVAPVINIVTSPTSRSRRSYPMSRYTSSTSSVSPSSASDDALLTPDTKNIQLSDWLQQQKTDLTPSEERLARHITGVSDQVTSLSAHLQRELNDIVLYMDALRRDAKPARVQARVLPDGTVQLLSGEIVDGIRGMSKPGAGRVLPDGTVMVGDSELEGIRGSPREPVTQEEAEEVEKRIKDAVQDERLSQLEDRLRDIISVAGSAYGSEHGRSAHLTPHAHSHHGSPGSHTKEVHDKDHSKEKVVEKTTHIDHLLPSAPAVPTPPGSKAGSASGTKKPKIVEDVTEWKYVPAGSGSPPELPKLPGAQTVSEYEGIIPSRPSHGIGSDTPMLLRPPGSTNGDVPVTTVGNVPKQKVEKPIWSTNPPHPSRQASLKSHHSTRPHSPEPEAVFGNIATEDDDKGTPHSHASHLSSAPAKERPDDDKASKASGSSGIDKLGEKYSSLGSLRVTNPDPRSDSPAPGSSVHFAEPPDKKSPPPVPPPPGSKTLPVPPVEPIDGMPPEIDFAEKYPQKTKKGKEDKLPGILKTPSNASGDAPSEMDDKDDDEEKPLYSFGNIATEDDDEPDAPTKPGSKVGSKAGSPPGSDAGKSGAGSKTGTPPGSDAGKSDAGKSESEEKPLSTLGNMATKPDGSRPGSVKSDGGKSEGGKSDGGKSEGGKSEGGKSEGGASKAASKAASVAASEKPKDDFMGSTPGRMPVFEEITLPTGQTILVRKGSIAIPVKAKTPAPSLAAPSIEPPSSAASTSPPSAITTHAGDGTAPPPSPPKGGSDKPPSMAPGSVAPAPGSVRSDGPPAKDDMPLSTLGNMSTKDDAAPGRALPIPPSGAGSKPPSMAPPAGSKPPSVAPPSSVVPLVSGGSDAGGKSPSPPSRPTTPAPSAAGPEVNVDPPTPPSRVMPSMGRPSDAGSARPRVPSD